VRQTYRTGNPAGCTRFAVGVYCRGRRHQHEQADGLFNSGSDFEMTGPLRNPRHEKFVAGLLEGKSALDAYEDAGYVADDANSSRLKSNPAVMARLAELQAEIAETSKVTVDGLIGELEDARKKASSSSQFSTAVRAVLGKAQLAGLLIEKKEVQVTDNSFEQMSDPRQIALAVINACLEFRVEHYHDLRDEDRERLVDLWFTCFKAFDEAKERLIAEVHARPLNASYKPPPKALPSPYNGKSRY
jgi:phage terminase small subunit